MKRKSRGNVDRRQAKHVKQHELNTAARLAEAGFEVVFRQPSDESTADTYVGGVRADLKSTKSVRVENVKRQVTRKRRKQGPNFVVDVGESLLPLDRVAAGMQELCDAYPDTEIASIMVVDMRPDGSVAVQTVGKEVRGWRR